MLALTPAPAELDLCLVLVEHLCERGGVPAVDAREPLTDALAYAEALVARDEQQRHAAREYVLDGAREIMLRREVDLRPHVRQLAVHAVAEPAIGLNHAA